MDYFFFHISEKYLQLKTSICYGKFLVHPIQVPGSTYCGDVFQTTYTSKDMCITLKGIGKILFVSVFRILPICKFLNFTVVFFRKKINPKFAYNFPSERVNFSLVHRTHIPIHSFCRTLSSS